MELSNGANIRISRLSGSPLPEPGNRLYLHPLEAGRRRRHAFRGEMKSAAPWKTWISKVGGGRAGWLTCRDAINLSHKCLFIKMEIDNLEMYFRTKGHFILFLPFLTMV